MVLLAVAALFTAPRTSAQMPPAAADAAPLSLQLLSPRGDGATATATTTTTTRAHVHVMGRTAHNARVQVGGEAAQVFSSGIFVRDQVPLALGANTIVVQAQTPDGQTATQDIVHKGRIGIHIQFFIVGVKTKILNQSVIDVFHFLTFFFKIIFCGSDFFRVQIGDAHAFGLTVIGIKRNCGVRGDGHFQTKE